MSCLIQKPENTAAIAAYIERLANVGFESNGLSIPARLFNALIAENCKSYGFLDEKKIFSALVKLNYTAYNTRYNCGGEDILPEYKENDISKYTQYNSRGGHFVVEAWHYRVFKMLQFFIYQCTEDIADETELYKGLQELENALAAFIIQNSAQYIAQDWE